MVTLSLPLPGVSDALNSGGAYGRGDAAHASLQHHPNIKPLR